MNSFTVRIPEFFLERPLHIWQWLAILTKSFLSVPLKWWIMTSICWEKENILSDMPNRIINLLPSPSDTKVTEVSLIRFHQCLALMINSERMSEEQNKAYEKFNIFLHQAWRKAHYFDMFNFASWQKLSTDDQARHYAKDCTPCSSIATCPQTVKPVSVPQVESESWKIADLEKKITEILFTSIDDDVDFIFRHNMSFSDYEKQRLDCGYISRNESLKKSEKDRDRFFNKGNVGSLDFYICNQDKLLAFMNDRISGDTINWSELARLCEFSYKDGKPVPHAGAVIKKLAEQQGFDTSQYNINKTVSGRLDWIGFV